MNMKKTIAAIAAGAVAVSAMATTVSALDATTLTYNLVKTVKEDNKGAGTITATFTNVPLEADGKLVIDTKSSIYNAMVTISGSFWDDEAGTNKSFVPVVATNMTWETGYSVEGEQLWVNRNDGIHHTGNDTWMDDVVMVPIVAGTAQGTATALKASSSAVITVTVKYNNLKNELGYVGDLNELIQKGTIGIQITSKGQASADSQAKNVVATYKINGAGAAIPVNVLSQDALNQLSGLSLKLNASGQWVTVATAAAYTVTSLNLSAGSVTNPAAVTVSAPTMLGGATLNDGGVYNLTAVSATVAVDTNGNTWPLTAATGIVITKGDTFTVKYTAATGASDDKTALVAQALSFMSPAAENDTLTFTKYEPAGAGADGVKYISTWAGAGVDVTAGNSEKKYPYHSTLKNSIYSGNIDSQYYLGGTIASNPGDGSSGSGDVISWIGYAGGDDLAKQVKIADAARSVINDCIQNYGDVVFTFNTATSKVKNGEYSTDDDAVDYTVFGKHWWNDNTGYDVNTIYIANDWLGNNLFEGALIINNNLTLSLGATDKFEWTSTSLSFSWDAIQDTALTQNQYANYIQNMVLRTSTDWYWDNMTVSLGATEAEDMGEGAPVEGDTEDLPEEEETDVDFGEEEEEEEEPEAPAEPEPEVAPVETATNPGTGNAPVALAVIPVALAAAAIVAKKRG